MGHQHTFIALAVATVLIWTACLQVGLPDDALSSTVCYIRGNPAWGFEKWGYIDLESVAIDPEETEHFPVWAVDGVQQWDQGLPRGGRSFVLNPIGYRTDPITSPQLNDVALIHQLRCLGDVRTAMQLANSTAYSIDGDINVMGCLEYLIRSLLCHSDNTLEAAVGPEFLLDLGSPHLTAFSDFIVMCSDANPFAKHRECEDLGAGWGQPFVGLKPHLMYMDWNAARDPDSVLVKFFYSLLIAYQTLRAALLQLPPALQKPRMDSSSKSEHASESLSLRPAKLSDVKAITDVAVPIVKHDGFHDYFFPHQDEFPEDMYRWWFRYYRTFILAPYVKVLVIENASKHIVGLAIWFFLPRATGGSPNDPVPRGLNLAKDSSFERLARSFYNLKDKISDKFFPNRAFDPAALVDWGKTEADLKAKLWSGEDRVNWHCPELFVLPKYKEVGYSPLLRWGFDHGRIDGLTCFAGSQVNQVELYEAEGMEKAMHLTCGPSEGWIVKKPRP